MDIMFRIFDSGFEGPAMVVDTDQLNDQLLNQEYEGGNQCRTEKILHHRDPSRLVSIREPVLIQMFRGQSCESNQTSHSPSYQREGNLKSLYNLCVLASSRTDNTADEHKHPRKQFRYQFRHPDAQPDNLNPRPEQVCPHPRIREIGLRVYDSIDDDGCSDEQGHWEDVDEISRNDGEIDDFLVEPAQAIDLDLLPIRPNPIRFRFYLLELPSAAHATME